jgi:hypothetical protein
LEIKQKYISIFVSSGVVQKRFHLKTEQMSLLSYFAAGIAQDKQQLSGLMALSIYW